MAKLLGVLRFGIFFIVALNISKCIIIIIIIIIIILLLLLLLLFTH